MATDTLTQDFQSLSIDRCLDRPFEKPLSNDPSLPNSSISIITAYVTPSISEANNAAASTASQRPPKSSLRIRNRKRNRISIRKGVKEARIQKTSTTVHQRPTDRTSPLRNPLAKRYSYRVSRQDLTIQIARRKDFMEDPTTRSRVRNLLNIRLQREFKGKLCGGSGAIRTKRWNLIDSVIKEIESSYGVDLARWNVIEILWMDTKQFGCKRRGGGGDGVACKFDKSEELDELIEGLEV